MSVITGIAGMAVEGGRIIVEYRQMQNSADVAALVGAQNAGCLSTDTSCQDTAITSACNNLQSNGYGAGVNTATTPYDCKSTSDTTVHAYIPPQTCSPYNLNYGNGKTPSSNCSGTSLSIYSYVEVTVSRNLGTVPIFRVSVTPFARAVARRGSQSPRDFALVTLDYDISNALGFSGSAGNKAAGTCGVCIVGSIMSNSTASSSINASGSGVDFACGGQWYTASTSESSPPSANMGSYTVGSAFFSPPGCTGTADGVTAWNYGQNPIADPYGNDGIPGASGWANCIPCASSGHYYHWKTSNGRGGGSWDDNGVGTPKNATGQDSYEYFPGSYPSGITINGGNNYFNPGAYNVGTGGFKVNGGNVCVFGAPICETFTGGYSGGKIPGQTQTCGSANMSTGSTYVAPATWYYYCSSWGTWDTKPPGYAVPGSTAATLAGETPHFTIGTTPTTTALNGVSFYSTTGSGASLTTTTGGSVDVEGNAVMSLAFPDPCPGTGTAAVGSIPFQSTMGSGYSGSTSGTYSYPSASEATALQTSPAGNLYPSADLTFAGETTCRSTLNSGDSSGRIPDVWPGESSANGQLLQFLFFLRDKSAIIKLAGGGTQIWWGIIYNPGNYPHGGCGANTSGSNGCEISLTGSSGSGGSGQTQTDIPMVVGQVIGDGVSVGGSSTLEIFYRPCDPRTSSCEQGPGSTLVQ